MSLNFDRVADEYDATRGGEQRGAHLAADLEPLLTGGGPALDVGTGTGVVPLALRRSGHHVIGIDLSPAMLRGAHDRLGPCVAVADAARLPFGDATFADAFAVWVMHTVGDRAAVLREVARVLRPGGRYLVCSNRHPEPDPITEIVAPMLQALRPPGDERHDLDALASLAGEHGFVPRGVVLGSPSCHTESPTELADVMARRSQSSLWQVTDEQWRDLVEPAIAGLRALGPARLPRVKRDGLLVLERHR